MIYIINYGAGNLASVQNMCKYLQYDTKVVSSAQEIHNDATTIILPGVGDGAYMMQELTARKFDHFLREWNKADKPLLGICVGAQVLLSFTEEGNVACLDIISGTCKSFAKRFLELGIDTHTVHTNYKIPHMGWNELVFDAQMPLFTDIMPRATAYFVHSFYLDVEEKSYTLAYAEYGEKFSAIIGKGNTIGTQFHPEKSGKWGLKIVDNYLQYYAHEAKSC